MGSDGRKQEEKQWYWNQDGRTVVPLKLNAWDGVYVVFAPSRALRRQTAITASSLQDLELEEKPAEVEAKGWLLASEKQAGSGRRNWKGKPFRAVKENRQPAHRQVLSARGWIFR